MKQKINVLPIYAYRRQFRLLFRNGCVAYRQGYIRAQYRLGVIYEQARDYVKARFYYTQAAKQGDAQAQNHLGVMYDLGQGIK